MTVSTAYAPLSFSGNDATTAFSVTWPFLDGTLVVTLVASTGVETVKTVSTHYTVSGGTDGDGLPATGSVTMLTAPATGETLRIERVTSKTQSSSWTNGGAFQAKTLESSLDKALLVGQEVYAAVAGSLSGIGGSLMRLVTSGATNYWDGESAIIRDIADGTAANDAVSLQQLQGVEAGTGSAFPTSSSHGAVLYRGSDGWYGLEPGTAGQFMKTLGVDADPGWQTIDGGGDMLSANNLSDVASASSARTNLGLVIGTNVQAYDAGLASIAGLTTAADKMIYTTGLDAYAVADLTAFARTLIDDASAATARTTLGLAIGTDVQAYDATLGSIAALGTAADKLAYTTGIDTWAEAAVTSYARTILDDADAATARSTLGLDSMATQAANNVAITGGSVTGITDLTVADGGTGASDAATARTNLGLVIGTNVQAYDADLQAYGALSSTGMVSRTGSGTVSTRSIAGGAAVAVTNGDGVSGSPSIAVDIAGTGDRPSFVSGDKMLISKSGTLYKIDYDDLPGAGGGITNAFSNVTDGSATAAASGADTFKLRVDTGMTVTVTNNDATHGDNALFGLDADLASWSSVTRASGFDTFTATPSSANLLALLTDETGTGAAVFATSPTLVTPLLGTPTSGNLANCTALPVAGITASTSTALGVGSIELGHATDTTVARSSAGNISVEGNVVYRASGTDVVVADGGTGLSSTTAYAVLCGGTTSTAALQSIASVGTSGHVLTSNGAGALPTFQSAGGTAGMVLLTSGTVSAASTLDIVLTSYTAYKSLLFVLSGFRPANDGDGLLMLFSSNGGSSYDASGYNYAGLFVRDSATTVTGFRSGSTTNVALSWEEIGSATTEGINIDIRLCNQTSTAFWSRVTFSGYYISSATTPAGVVVTGGGSRETAQDTDAVRFLFNSGNIAAGNYAVYGLA